MNKQKINKFVEWSAWGGAVLVLGSYFLIASGFLSGDDWIYHGMVLLGSFFLGVIAYVKHVPQSVVLNAVFCTLAVIGLVRVTLF